MRLLSCPYEGNIIDNLSTKCYTYFVVVMKYLGKIDNL